MSYLNVLGNNIGVEQAQALLKIKKEKGMATLCGLSGSETKLDLSNKGLSPGCAVLLSPEIGDNGALSKLNIGNNDLRAEGCKALAGVLNESSVTDLNIANSRLTLKADAKTLKDTDYSGLCQLADGVMSILDISNNNLGPDGAKALALAMWALFNWQLKY